MAVSDYEIDITLLEDMCSELEESAFLVDKDLTVVWTNIVLKERLKSSGYDTSLPMSIGAGITHIFGLNVLTDQNIKKVFSAGKLTKSIISSNNQHFRKISLPIKFGNEVVFVLEIIENDPLSVHNAGLHESMMKFFLGNYKHSCILVSEDRSLIVANDLFDSEFSKSAVLKKLILDSMHENNSSALKYLKSLLALTHVIEIKSLKQQNKNLGTVFLFKRGKSK